MKVAWKTSIGLCNTRISCKHPLALRHFYSRLTFASRQLVLFVTLATHFCNSDFFGLLWFPISEWIYFTSNCYYTDAISWTFTQSGQGAWNLICIPFILSITIVLHILVTSTHYIILSLWFHPLIMCSAFYWPNHVGDNTYWRHVPLNIILGILLSHFIDRDLSTSYSDSFFLAY